MTAIPHMPEANLASDPHLTEGVSRPRDIGLLCAKKLGIKQAATMIGIGETKLREFIREGEIPTLLIDGKYQLLESDLEAFLQNHYGPLKRTEYRPNRMPPLPKDIATSGLLKKAS